MLTLKQLQDMCITQGGKDRSETFLPGINAGESDLLTTPERLSAFLAQVLHESGEFRYLAEIASGRAYEGRADLGNLQPGDGVRFKGRGLIQITGRTNYEHCGEALGLDLIAEPELLEDPAYAVASALWFWRAHGLNALADKRNLAAITHIINGGMNGWQDRLAYYQRAQDALNEVA